MKQRYLRNVVTLKLDQNKCVGCGRCLVVCPHGVFDWDSSKAEENPRTRVRVAYRDACMECGACRQNCVAGAIGVSVGVGCAAAMGTVCSATNRRRVMT